MAKNRENPTFTFPVNAADEGLVRLWVDYFKNIVPGDEALTSLQREHPEHSTLRSGVNYELNPYVERNASAVFRLKSLTSKIFGIKERFGIVMFDTNDRIVDATLPSNTLQSLSHIPITPIRYLIGASNKHLV